MQEEQGGKKGVRRRERYISLCSQWHDEIHDNRLWTQCGKRSGIRRAGRNEEGKAGTHEMCAWNVAEGEQRRKRGFGGRDTGRQEQASKWQGEMNSWRRNLHREVCVCLVNVCAWVCIHMHLYTDAYSYLVARLEQTCPRTPVNIICKNKHLPIQLSASF